MTHSPRENQDSFEEFIELDLPMTPAEAANELARFHNSTPENVLAAFMNLRNCQPDEVVTFMQGSNNSAHCVRMEGRDASGKFKWSSLIHPYSGQPTPHCS